MFHKSYLDRIFTENIYNIEGIVTICQRLPMKSL